MSQKMKKHLSDKLKQKTQKQYKTNNKSECCQNKHVYDSSKIQIISS